MTLNKGRVQPPDTSRKGRGSGSRRLAAVLTAAAMVVAVSGCSDGKSYDISPLFPLDPNKCARYDGNVDGSGPLAHCWVTKDKCQQAASDWHQEMANVPDAIEFTC